MVQIYFYGKLRRYSPQPRMDRESVLHVELQPGETVRSVLQRLGIPESEVFHVFLNGRLLVTGNSMAPWLRYPSFKGQGLDTPLKDGDRLGLFGRDMPMLVV